MAGHEDMIRGRLAQSAPSVGFGVKRDEIESLLADLDAVRAERDRMREALREIAEFPPERNSGSSQWGKGYALSVVQSTASAALSPIDSEEGGRG